MELGLGLHWQMTNCERFALLGLLKRIQPKLSIEIGTYMGGSVQVLALFSEAVISVDIDPGVATRLDGKFSNVEFRSGDSRHLLPDLITELNRQGRSVDFVLIDGEHSTEGVRRDIEAVLGLQPQQELLILLHDSFNPRCREGMRKADWAKSPFVRQVELDFIPGVYHYEAHDTAEARSMWGGFACALLSPEKRTGKVVIQESQRQLYESVKRDSMHRFEGKGWFRRKWMRFLEAVTCKGSAF